MFENFSSMYLLYVFLLIQAAFLRVGEFTFYTIRSLLYYTYLTRKLRQLISLERVPSRYFYDTNLQRVGQIKNKIRNVAGAAYRERWTRN